MVQQKGGVAFLHLWHYTLSGFDNTDKAFSKRKNRIFILLLTGYVWFGRAKLILNSTVTFG